MGIVYFRRFRMEIDLAQPLLPQPATPPDYRLAPWDDRLLETHAETKFPLLPLGDGRQRLSLAQHPRRLPAADDGNHAPAGLRCTGHLAARPLAANAPPTRARAERFRA